MLSTIAMGVGAVAALTQVSLASPFAGSDDLSSLLVPTSSELVRRGSSLMPRRRLAEKVDKEEIYNKDIYKNIDQFMNDGQRHFPVEKVLKDSKAMSQMRKSLDFFVKKLPAAKEWVDSMPLSDWVKVVGYMQNGRRDEFAASLTYEQWRDYFTSIEFLWVYNDMVKDYGDYISGEEKLDLRMKAFEDPVYQLDLDQKTKKRAAEEPKIEQVGRVFRGWLSMSIEHSNIGRKVSKVDIDSVDKDEAAKDPVARIAIRDAIAHQLIMNEREFYEEKTGSEIVEFCVMLAKGMKADFIADEEDRSVFFKRNGDPWMSTGFFIERIKLAVMHLADGYVPPSPSLGASKLGASSPAPRAVVSVASAALTLSVAALIAHVM